MHASNEPEIRGADPMRDYDDMSVFDVGDDFPLANQLLDEAYAQKKQGNFKAAEKLMLVARAYLDVKCEMDEEAASTAVNYRSYLLLGNLYYDMGEWKKGYDALMKSAWTWDMFERRDRHAAAFTPGPMVHGPILRRCEENEAAQQWQRCKRRAWILLAGVLVWWSSAVGLWYTGSDSTLAALSQSSVHNVKQKTSLL